MGTEIRILMVVSMALCLTSAVHGDNGNAVYYNPSRTAPACRNPARGQMVTGVSDKLWNGGAACGRRYRVKCIGANNAYQNACHSNPTVDVTVVDYCRPPCNGDFNLHRSAFAKIADLDAGNIKIQYDRI